MAGRDRGDAVFKNQVQGYAEVFPMSLAMGMSMGMSQHIQLAVDDIVGAVTAAVRGAGE